MDVHIQDNTLILVGENGTGKSTFVNLIYYFLTRQWNRLREYRFHEIVAVLDKTELNVTPERLEEFVAFQREQNAAFRHLHPSVRRTVRRTMEQLSFPNVDNQYVLSTLMSELDISPRRARDLMHQYETGMTNRPPALLEIGKTIASLMTDQFLYLPTYRRIEQELKSIFRGSDMEPELKSIKERLAQRMSGHYVELVEFGMEDVEQTIAKRMAQIKESVRTGLDNLTGTYLRDVIRGVHTHVGVNAIRDIDSNTLDSMFARIDENTLPALDKQRLIAKVQEMAGHSQIKSEDQVIAHFLTKLLELYTEQEASERNVREFVKVCNEYLGGKELVYDNIKYTIFLRQQYDLGEQSNFEDKVLQLQNLSSGEKQIVSLFSHVYLSGAKSFFVIIDEPELSLSVPWQRKFLPDIVRSGLSNGMVAVSHSPFVWDNALEPYVRSLAEFTSPHHVVR